MGGLFASKAASFLDRINKIKRIKKIVRKAAPECGILHGLQKSS